MSRENYLWRGLLVLSKLMFAISSYRRREILKQNLILLQDKLSYCDLYATEGLDPVIIKTKCIGYNRHLYCNAQFKSQLLCWLQICHDNSVSWLQYILLLLNERFIRFMEVQYLWMWAYAIRNTDKRSEVTTCVEVLFIIPL